MNDKQRIIFDMIFIFYWIVMLYWNGLDMFTASIQIGWLWYIGSLMLAGGIVYIVSDLWIRIKKNK